MTPLATTPYTRDDLSRRAREEPQLQPPGEASQDALTRANEPASTLIDRRLRGLLGWKPDLGNPAALKDALLSTYEVREVEGTSVAQRKQRTQVTILNDLSLLSGAQAAMYGLTMTTLNTVLPLLRGLKPIDPTADPDACENIRVLIERQLENLLAELGNQEGPDEPGVQRILDDLMGKLDSPGDGLGGHLRQLQDRYRLHERYAHSPADRDQLTTFRNVVSQLHGLARGWQENLKNQNQPGLLGSHYTAFLRHLPLVGDAVQEVRSALHKGGMSHLHQQTFTLRFTEKTVAVPVLPLQPQLAQVEEDIPRNANGHPQELSLAQLLETIDTWVLLTGPQLIQDTGRDGVRTFLDHLLHLRRLVYAAQPGRSGVTLLGAHQGAYTRDAVKKALKELAHRLDETCDRAVRVVPSPPPRITGVRWAGGTELSEHIRLDILGEQFDRKAHIEIHLSDAAQAPLDIVTTWHSAQRMTVQFQSPPTGAAVTVKVVHPDGQHDAAPWDSDSSSLLPALRRLEQRVEELEELLRTRLDAQSSETR